MKSITPLGDRVVVRQAQAEEKLENGLIIPNADKPLYGEVLAVGPGRHDNGVRIPIDVEVGDQVVYSRYGGTEFQLEDGPVLLLAAPDLLGKVDV